MFSNVSLAVCFFFSVSVKLFKPLFINKYIRCFFLFLLVSLKLLFLKLLQSCLFYSRHSSVNLYLWRFNSFVYLWEICQVFIAIHIPSENRQWCLFTDVVNCKLPCVLGTYSGVTSLWYKYGLKLRIFLLLCWLPNKSKRVQLVLLF